MSIAQDIKKAIHPKTSPLTKAVRERRYERWFATSPDAIYSFRGTYRSIEEAARAAPKALPVGFNLPEYAAHHVDRTQRVFAHDYPAMFWLRDILPKASRLLDLGGNVGVHYYGYGRYLSYPKGLSWQVCDLPEVVALGRKMAESEGATQLTFTCDEREANGADVLLSAGALQFIDGDFAERLGQLPRPPEHIVLNKVPLYDGPDYVTLQNVRVAFVPYRVFNRARFLESLERAGYKVIDQWEVHGFGCGNRFRPESRVELFTGLYARRGHDAKDRVAPSR